MNIIIYGMVYLGSILMVYNIYGFVKFARYVKGLKNWGTQNGILYLPIVLLVFFLMALSPIDQAYSALGENATEAVIDRVFERFCVGK